MRLSVLSTNISIFGSPKVPIALARGVAAVLLVGLAACAEVPSDPEARASYDRANDPAEPTNRIIFAGNQWFDRNALQPVARAYKNHLPDRVQKSLHNATRNLKAPVVLVNDTLQANFGRAWTTTQRFAVNSTVGGAGLFDVATDWNLPSHDADFGQTFGVWGIGPGPSLQLPLLGPSNVRDAAGIAVGFVADPLNYVPGGAIQTIQLAGAGVSAVDQRAEMLSVTDDLEKDSLDYYAALRSTYAQHRAALVEEGKAGGSPGRVNAGPAMPQPDATPETP
jgi:phospholipid-binding lipoprotein MlaA